MNTLGLQLRRELRVCFSPKAQPLWFRIVKWSVGLAFIARYHGASWFWLVVAVWSVVTFALHFVYRRQTRAWTRPWGGWSDVQTADGLR